MSNTQQTIGWQVREAHDERLKEFKRLNGNHEIEIGHIKEISLLMRDYDKKIYTPKIKQLRDACGVSSSGHNFRFVDTNPLGAPIFTCSICGKTEIRKE